MMILIACGFVFAALFTVAVGFHLISQADRREQIRRRLFESDNLSDALDPRIMREKQSRMGIFGRMLDGLQLAQRLENLHAQAAVQTSVSMFFLITLGLAAFTGLLTYLFSHHPLLSLVAGVAVSFLPLVVLLIKRDRRSRAFTEQFPEAIDLMVNALRAGFAMNSAIQMVAEESPDPVGQEFRIVYEEQQLGLDVRTALLNLAKRMDSTDAALFVTAVLIQRDTGGNLAEVLESIAHVIRDRFRILGEVRTFTAQGRMSGLILALLPLIVAFMLTLMSPGYMDTLLTTKAGNILINVAIILQIIGFISVQRIINVKV